MKPFFVYILWTLSSLKLSITQATFNGVKWNKRLGEFVRITGLSSFEVERRIITLQFQQQEILNFNGQPLRLTYFEDYGFFHFHDNNTKATGICGDIYTLLSQFLNFTLVLSNNEEKSLGITLPNGSHTGITELARLNKTDIIPKMPVFVTKLNAVTYAPVLWVNSQRIFAYGQWKRNYFWMFTIFPKEVWCLIGFSILTLSVLSLITEKVLIRYDGLRFRSRSYRDHLFYLCSTLCNQINESDSISRESKILALTISVFCWLILIGYNSHLIYSMTVEVFDAPFHDLTTLLENTKFHVAVLRGSVAHTCFTSTYTYAIFHRIVRANRVKVLSNIEDLYHQVCFNPDKYVLLDAEDAMAVRKDTFCKLLPVGSAYYKLPVASGISRGLKNKKGLDIGIMKLREFGIIDAIKKRYMRPLRRDIGYRQTDNLAIDMDRVSVIFGVLCLGIFASIMICVAENMIFTFKKRKSIQNFIERLPPIKQPLYVRSVYTQKCNKNKMDR